MRAPDAAELLVIGCAGALGVGDIFLYRHGRRLVTEVLRTPTALAGLVVLTAHALDVLGPLDPFRAFSRLIPKHRSH